MSRNDLILSCLCTHRRNENGLRERKNHFLRNLLTQLSSFRLTIISLSAFFLLLIKATHTEALGGGGRKTKQQEQTCDKIIIATRKKLMKRQKRECEGKKARN